MRDVATLLASLFLLTSSCGGSGTPDTTSTSSGTGGSGTGSSGISGAGGSGGGASCPLDAAAQGRAERMITAAVADASWIGSQSHGHGVGADRAFGGAVPFTNVAHLSIASVAEACTDAKPFDEYCDDPGPGEPANPFTRCSKLACTGPGKLTVHAWLKPLPFTTDADPGPGKTEVSAFDNLVAYEETGASGLTVTWTTEVEVTPPGSSKIHAKTTGKALVEGTEATSITFTDPIEGLAASPLELTTTIAGMAGSGEGTIAGIAVVKVDASGIAWIGPCAP